MEIEERDEWNISIANAAKATGFGVMTSLFSTVTLVMALLGYVTEIVFFAFFAIFLVSQVPFIAKLWYLQKKI